MKILFLTFFLFLSAGVSAASRSVESQDSDFIAAREAYAQGNGARLAMYAERMRGHVLEPYLAFYQLRLRLEDADTDTVKAFLSKHHDSPLADNLRGEWLKLLAKNGQWGLFAQEYPTLIGKDTALQCYAWQPRLALKDPVAQAEARGLWLTAGGRDLPDACSPVFDALITAHVLDIGDVWARLRQSLAANNVSVARHVNQALPDKQMLNEAALGAAANNPSRYLEQQQKKIKSAAEREIALFALLRWARSSTGSLDQAYAFWPKIRVYFSKEEHAYFMGQLAHLAARKQHPQALNWFLQAEGMPNTPLNDAELGWKIRAALRADTPDWPTVLASIKAMSAAEQENSAWRYWKARALKAAGKSVEANVLFAALGAEPNFYGQLAAEENRVIVGAPTHPAPLISPIHANEIAAVAQIPAIQRALALYRLNLRVEATREWNFALRGLDDRMLLAAAKVAERHAIYDRMISSAERTAQQHDFGLRYPAPHREAMQSHLQQQALDEAWVYGLIRQESRFMHDAKSSAGAMGLMQLMPATALWVAKKMGLIDYKKSLVTEINTNFALGTYYLKHVLTSLDNQPLLASAAYNAGPGRARAWRGAKPLEGAIYAETIPFDETRTYVKNVMSNATHYAATFGQPPQSFKQRLGVVAPSAGSVAADVE